MGLAHHERSRVLRAQRKGCLVNTAILLILSHSHWTVWTGYMASNSLSQPGEAESLTCPPVPSERAEWTAGHMPSGREQQGVERTRAALCPQPCTALRLSCSPSWRTHTLLPSPLINQRCDSVGLCTILAQCFLKQNLSFSKRGRQRELLALLVNNAKIFDCFCLSFRRIAVRNKSSEACFRKGERGIRNHSKRWQSGEGTIPGAGVSGLWSPSPCQRWPVMPLLPFSQGTLWGQVVE